MQTDRLCHNLICLLHAPIRAYEADGKQVAFYVDQGEQEDILACDPVFRDELLEIGKQGRTMLHFEDAMIAYGIVPAEAEVYILGPVYLGDNLREASKLLTRKHGMSRKDPYRVARCSLLDFAHFVLLLAEQLTDTSMSASELCRNSVCAEEFEHELRKQIERVNYIRLEDGILHNPYAQEEREQASIRTGNLEALRESFKEVYVGRLGTLAADPLRNRKNHAITVIALASRSAIAGGVSPEMAFTMSDAFNQRVEEMSTEAEVYALMRHAEVEFCTAVRKAAPYQGRSALVRRCKELISGQLHAKPTVASLARELSVSPDYLSRTFKKEEGVRLSDYIAQQKISSAMNHLLYSDDSYEAIAATYGYTSQSHFIQVFKKLVGMTPREYREQNSYMPRR